MNELKKIELFAWLGEDEMGSGEIGIKQAMVPAGMIPIVSTNCQKVDRDFIKQQMDMQGKRFGKKIRLCKFVFEEVIVEVGQE
jgi:hypothetical protein